MIECDMFYRLTQHIEEINQVNGAECRFIICGDLNARIGSLNDFVPNDISRHIEHIQKIILGIWHCREIHQFCKRLLGVKKSTQNNFVYGEFGRINFQTRRFFYNSKILVKNCKYGRK